MASCTSFLLIVKLYQFCVSTADGERNSPNFCNAVLNCLAASSTAAFYVAPILYSSPKLIGTYVFNIGASAA
nr:MAG TPA: hypothetical protein [Crassvirales sp.]DAQ45770.1 MAG TPA: hypothetical protein [Caudoviricetes sp.]DAR45760.1 MAG TPA: hypothetical protein [Bacteriophage sp.]